MDRRDLQRRRHLDGEGPLQQRAGGGTEQAVAVQALAPGGERQKGEKNRNDERAHPCASSLTNIAGNFLDGESLDRTASPQQIGERIALYRRELEAAGHAFEPMRVAVARNIFVARHATEKHEAISRQTQIHERLLSLSRGSESRPGSHILGYADTPEAHSLIGTAEEVEAGLAALK